MKRRSFIKHLGHAVAVPGVVGSFGFTSPLSVARMIESARETNRVLVMIFLSGGNDGLNTIVPLDEYSRYDLHRPNVALPESSLLNLPNRSLAFHPSLSFLRSLYDEKRLAIVQSVGYPNQNFSHFRSTDIWMSASDSNEFLTSGWTGRLLNHEFPDYPEGYPNDDFEDPLAIEIGNGGSLLFQGPTAAMSMTISNPNDFYRLISNNTGEVPDTLAGDKLKHIRLIAQQSQQYGEVVKKASERVGQQVEYPQSYLANQLKIVSRLIAGGLRTPVYLVRIGGFDTHADQVDRSDPTRGWHANLLNDLDSSINAFMSDLEYLGIDDKVLGMTFSEFGRRIIANASFGTDHGSAAPMFVFGNKVNGGVYGEDPVLPSNRSSQNNLPAQYDFRSVYGSVLEQWFAMGKSDVNSILLGDFPSLPIVEDPAFIGINSDVVEMSVFPNPLKNQANIVFISDGEPVEVSIFDRQGRKIQQLYQGTPVSGKKMIEWNTSTLPIGVYIVLVKGQNMTFSRQVIKRKDF